MVESTCDLYDQHEGQARVLASPFRDFGGRSEFAGEAVTIKCFEDNSRVKEMAEKPGSGKVMVVDGGGSLRTSLLGDMIAGTAVKAGWEGIILFGCVRDRVALRALDLGVKALGATPRKSVRNGEGLVGIPIQIAGVDIRPGDRVVADEDGIIILDRPTE